MRQFPTGTVTFLFTDIEGATRLLQELGDGYAEALAEHRRLLREAFSTHGGVEVDTQGDAFFVAFARAPDAVAAAGAGQRALEAGPIRVRMGIHTGEPLVAEDGYVGIDVHRAARICSTAHGGQIVFSERTRALIDDGFRVADLGLHRLKDLVEPAKLFQLGKGDFPPLRSLNATNLPTQPTPLVGRERELAEVLRLLGSARLVTLTGAGGSGKTRLALQAAAELVDEFRDGVFWVSLAALTDPELVPPTIAASVGAKDDLAQFLDEKRVLLLLDNLEQILACAPAIAELLRRCPNLKLLVTSRAPLRISGEQEYEVPPLPEAEAIELFTQRARQVKPSFQHDENVAQICRRLDGLPLAVELAAARVKLLSPQQILERLGHSLDLLTGGARDLPERQQTLRATIAWSYDLLPENKRSLFARLGVFAGSFDFEGAQMVCDTDLDTLAALIDGSLLRQTDDGRFFMLETVREYALEQLERSKGAEAVGGRHATHYLGVAEAAEPELKAGARQAGWLERLDREHDNLRSALARFSAGREIELELRLAAALGRFWYLRGYLDEGSRRLKDALAKGSDTSAQLRAKTLTGATYIALARGDSERAKRFAQERLSLYRELGDPGGVAEAVNDLAWAASVEGEWECAIALEEESSELFRAAGDAWGLAVSLNNLGSLAGVLGDYERGIALCTESAAIARTIGDTHLEATALCSTGYTHLHADEPSAAAPTLRESLRLAAEIGEKAVIYRCLDGLAAVSLAGGDLKRTARLLAAAEAVAETSSASLDPSERELHERTVSALHGHLADEFLCAAWTAGRAMTLDDAIAYADERLAQPAQSEPST